MTEVSAGKEYQVTGLLGSGGFGRVYRAKLTAGDGFERVVAIKILTAKANDDDAAARFRDEARILGRLRDRAIPVVDPPTRLNGKWAVVMQYIDGTNCHTLQRQLGPLPLSVVLGVVEEVATTLDNLWNQPGDDGEPLKLLHRDIKPGNIMLTPSGQVFLLDFGIARADFVGRESHTTSTVGGTVGYIPPERLHGKSGPEGDVYALGVVMQHLLTGAKAEEIITSDDQPNPAWDPDMKRVMQFAVRMRSPKPADRPTAREVARFCIRARALLPPPDLLDWSRLNVPKAAVRPDDELVGSTLTEDARLATKLRGGLDTEVPTRLGAGRVAGSLAFLSSGLLFVVSLLILAIAIVFGVGLDFGGGTEPEIVAGVEPGAPDDGKLDPTASDPVGDAAEPKTEPQPEGKPKPGVKPQPAAKPKPKPAARGPRGSVAFTGDSAIVTLRRAGEVFSPGALPVGTYEVWANFGEGAVQAGSVEIAAGTRKTMRCVAGFRRCLPE